MIKIGISNRVVYLFSKIIEFKMSTVYISIKSVLYRFIHVTTIVLNVQRIV